MRRLSATAAIVLVLLAAPAARSGPPRPIPRRSPATGRASLKLGAATTLDYDVDFNRKGAGWSGDITIPAQGIRDLPLEGISLAGDAGRLQDHGHARATLLQGDSSRPTARRSRGRSPRAASRPSSPWPARPTRSPR